MLHTHSCDEPCNEDDDDDDDDDNDDNDVDADDDDNDDDGDCVQGLGAFLSSEEPDICLTLELNEQVWEKKMSCHNGRKRRRVSSGGGEWW